MVKNNPKKIPFKVDEASIIDAIDKPSKAVPVSESEDIRDMFSKEVGQDNPIRDLFDDKNIKVKTDVTKDEGSIISRLYFQAEMFNLPELALIVDELIILRVSKDRKSRAEFVDAHKSELQNQQGSGFFNKFGNLFNKG